MANQLATMSKTDLASALNRARSIAKNVREKSETSVQRLTGVVAAGAGGFAAGVLDHRVPEVQGLPTAIVGGLLLGVAGSLDMAGKASEALTAFGGGMLAGGMALKGRQFSEELDE